MRALRVFLLFLKRLYCRKTFFLLIMVLPILIVSIRVTSSGSDGIMRVAIFFPGESSAYVEQLEDGLKDYSDVINFQMVSSKREARNLVRTRKADVAWVFKADIDEKINAMVKGGDLSPVVTVYQIRKNSKSTISRLSSEVLAANILKHAVYSAYEGYIRNTLGISTDAVSDQEIRDVYDEMHPDRKLITLSYPDEADNEDIPYLMAPVRGIMAAWLLACAFVAAIYTVTDEKNGLYGGVNRRTKIWMSLAGGLAVMINAVAVFILGILGAGVFTDPLREFINLMLYTAAVCGTAYICTMISCGNLSTLCILMVAELMATIALSPVIAGVGLPQVQWLIPANMYLKGTHSRPYIYRLVIFDVAVAGVVLIKEAVYYILVNRKMKRRQNGRYF